MFCIRMHIDKFGFCVILNTQLIFRVSAAIAVEPSDTLTEGVSPDRRFKPATPIFTKIDSDGVDPVKFRGRWSHVSGAFTVHPNLLCGLVCSSTQSPEERRLPPQHAADSPGSFGENIKLPEDYLRVF